MKSTRIDNEYAEIWLEDGIIFSLYKKNEMKIEHAKILVNERLKVNNGKAYPIFIQFHNLVSSDAEVRKYLSGKEAIHLLTAGAILTTNPIARLLGNLFLSVNKPAIPSRLFTDKEKALEWLQQFKQPG